MAATTEAARLTDAYRTAQVRRGAVIAAIVAAYLRSKVNPEDPLAVSAWLDLMIPRIIDGHDYTGRLATAYGQRVAGIEVPGAVFDISPSVGAEADQVRRSLTIVGPGDYLNKARDIRTLDVSPIERTALLRDAKEVMVAKVAAATVRHVQNGGRQTLIDASERNAVALGYVRVTKAKPCFFCAMLASRGLIYRGFKEDSFAESDARFIGEGTVKVHDSCACTMKPIFTEADEVLDRTKAFTDMWSQWGAGGGGSAAAKRFRRGYDHWFKTGEMLDHDVVADDARYRARNDAA